MTATELRSDLLQQIEQADEKLLRILSSVLEAVKVEYVADASERMSEEVIADLRTPQMSAEEYEASLKPMTHAELIARAEASNEDIAAGRVYSREEAEKILELS